MQKIDSEHYSDRRTIRKASMDDLPIIMDFLRQGRENDNPIATFAFLPGPEPTYSYIEGGHWLDNSPYYVIHRVASMDGVHGIMADIIAYCSSVAHALRIDTHADNRPMQKALSRLGFAYCGVIYLQSGDSRMAFQKITSAL